MSKLQDDEKKEQLNQYVTQNQEKLYRLCYSYTKDKEASLDVLQEAIYKALNKLSTLQNTEYLTTWFYRILVNENLKYVQKNKRKIKTEICLEDYELDYEPKDTLENLEIYRYVEALEPKLRTVVILRFFEDMKLNDITAITNTNVNTVKSRLYKALKILRKALTEGKYYEKF